jgi:2-hydroxy-6-oxo-octa-2,4-dienoate hydrolase
MTQAKRPEIGATVVANGIKTNYLEDGKGSPVVFIHGSGPGVTAYANWRLVMPGLAPHFRTLAPDMVGFGYTERPDGIGYDVQVWADQVTGFLDALDIRTASLVGNSFGGAIALRVVTQHPERVDKLVLMGSIGVPFPITEGLDRVWGYQPSAENMRQMLGIFAYSPELANDDRLARIRYEASIQPGFQEAFSSMFPPPRQSSVDEMVIPDDELRKIAHETLIVHGRGVRLHWPGGRCRADGAASGGRIPVRRLHLVRVRPDHQRRRPAPLPDRRRHADRVPLPVRCPAPRRPDAVTGRKPARWAPMTCPGQPSPSSTPGRWRATPRPRSSTSPTSRSCLPREWPGARPSSVTRSRSTTCASSGSPMTTGPSTA